MSGVAIVPIREEHIASYHAALDSVAREKRYLLFLEGPPLKGCAAYVKDNIRQARR